ncbi:hypothetical protein [Paractinoplanes hotanensis]|uniref:Uncharacterized protein n=1 Tax=Paractinoplanes hotanensis TaxID=2906497 RepID=A0ABT0YEK6_9ACTN|nr:hypothetical protein [Actinoplanes hotanensis]MCM4084240.1 hypothetical protein [Actinoplanes hotanensis]
MTGPHRIAADLDEINGGPFGPFYAISQANKDQLDRDLLLYDSSTDARGEFDEAVLRGLVPSQKFLAVVVGGLVDLAEGRGDSVDRMGGILRDAGDVTDSLAQQMPGEGPRPT